MRIPDSILKCINFIGTEQDGEIRYRGTGFFVIVQHNEGGIPWRFSYLVTAKHVAEAVKDSVFYVRANIKGTDEAGDIAMNWEPEKLTEWYSHPTDPDADVVVTPVGIPEEVDALCLPEGMILSESKRAELNIGIGDEVFIIGLFSYLKGRTKNIPIARTGNIAMFPDEKIPVQDHRGYRKAIDGFVIEARSIGGLSGSPVFARRSMSIRGAFREHRTAAPITVTVNSDPFYLLGLISSHWDADPTDINEPEPKMTRSGVNMGLAVVVPAHRILEVLGCEELRQIRRVESQQAAEKHKDQT